MNAEAANYDGYENEAQEDDDIFNEEQKSEDEGEGVDLDENADR